MRVTDNMTVNNAIYNINRGKLRLNQLNELLASNQNINRPSDDPIGTRQILDLQSQVSSIDQYMTNITNAQTWMDVANTSLQSMNDFITQAKAVASNILQGTKDSVSVSNALATLNNVRQQLSDLANVKIGEQYVFGGFSDSAPVVSNKALNGVVDVTKPPNKITGIDTSGLIVGMSVSGKGIQPGTTITAIDGVNKTVTLSNNPLYAGTGFDYTFGMPTTTQTTGNVSLTAARSQITGLDTTGLTVGAQVVGPGVPLGARIQVIDINGSPGQVTLDKQLTQETTGGTFSFFDATTSVQTGNVGSLVTLYGGALGTPPPPTTTTLSFVDTSSLHVGAAVAGSGVPANTTITAIDTVNHTVTVSNPVTVGSGYGTDFTFTNPSDVISGIDTTGLNAGDTVTGPAGVVAPGTTIASVNADGTVTLSAPLLMSSLSGGIFAFTPAASPMTQVAGDTSFSPNKITGLDTTNLTAGMAISGPGVPAGSTITSIDSASQITISNTLTQAVTGGSFTFQPTVTKAVGGGLQSTTIQSNQLTNLPNVTSLTVGMSVSGPGIPPNTVITATPTSVPPSPAGVIYLSNNATQTTAGGTFTFGPTVTKTGTTDPPNQITGLPLDQLQNLYVGMKVSGPGIPADTVITAIDATDTNGTGSVTLSKAPTGVGGAGQFVFEGYIESYGSRTMMGTVTNGSATVSGLATTATMAYSPAVSKTGSTSPSVNPNQITGLNDTSGLTVGMLVTDTVGGAVIPPNTIVSHIDPVTNTVTLSNPLTPPTTQTGADALAGPPYQITGLAGTAGLYVGMSVSGPGIPANTTITAIGAGTVDLSNAPTAASPAGTQFSFGATTLQSSSGVGFNFTSPVAKTGVTTALSNQITGLADTSNLFVGMPVSDTAGGTTIPPNTVITAIDRVNNIITLSNNAQVSAPTGTKLLFTPTMPIAGVTDPVATPNTITGIANTTNLYVGMPVTGPGIPANTVITGTPASVPPTAANTVTISSNPTVAMPAGVFYFGHYSSMGVSGNGISPATTIGSVVNGSTVKLSSPATQDSSLGGTQLTFSGYFSGDDIKVNIGNSSQVALNYSGTKLLLGGAPSATSQSSAPPSTIPVNILGTIGELMTAIQNGDNAAIIAAASNLKTAADQVTLAQTEYASRSMRLDSAKTMLTSNQNTLKNIISSKQELDTAKTIVLLQQQTTAYQAALEGTAKILPMSLLDYLT